MVRTGLAWPFLDRLERQAETIGRLEIELAERDRRIAEFEALLDAPETSILAPPRVDSPEGDESHAEQAFEASLADRFRRWWRVGSG